MLGHVNLRPATQTNQQTHQAHYFHRIVAARNIRVDQIDRFLVRRVAGRTLDPDLVKQRRRSSPARASTKKGLAYDLSARLTSPPLQARLLGRSAFSSPLRLNARLVQQGRGSQSTSAHHHGASTFHCESCCSSTSRLHRRRTPRLPSPPRKDPRAVRAPQQRVWQQRALRRGKV